MSKVAQSSAERDGWVAPVALFAAVSFFVAFFNLLPLPPLDGFHIFQALYEHIASRVKRRQVRLDPVLINNFTRLVMVCILFLGLGAILLDVLRPISSVAP
jgi:membrane-associated protease RseP (regulator of RpoE activity)